MAEFIRLNLDTEQGSKIRINKDYIKPYEEEVLEILDGQDYMRKLPFARSMMISQELKANNVIEGIKDDLSIIDDVITQRKDNLTTAERKRIINLYHGYEYILTHKNINKESLRELYSKLSEGILDEYAVTNMGEYYREKPVYILKGSRVDTEPFQGMKAEKVDYYMNQLFEFINSDIFEETEIDKFIKSQIMHFYFVYIHPYFDVNGRTSRTTAMWYLLNQQNYPYIIFNRAISFNKRKYEENIVKGRERGNITLFIKYMLESVQKELEKEYIIHNIEQNANIPISKEERQLLEYLLTIKGHHTMKDLIEFYNHYNSKKNLRYMQEKVEPLLKNGILINKGNARRMTIPNMKLGLNPELIEIDKLKVKHLDLDEYI